KQVFPTLSICATPVSERLPTKGPSWLMFTLVMVKLPVERSLKPGQKGGRTVYEYVPTQVPAACLGAALPNGCGSTLFWYAMPSMTGVKPAVKALPLDTAAAPVLEKLIEAVPTCVA